MVASFELVEPSTLAEALEQLDARDPGIRPIGGGTALMLMMKAQMFQPQRLVGLRRLDTPMSTIALDADGTVLRIGAMTTFSALERSPVVRELMPVVTETMKTLANVRVRNVATVGGNIAHGDPHLDLPPVWVALGAEALVVGRSHQRTLALEDMFLGYYETALAEGELIAELRVPIRPGWTSKYVKVTTRAAHDWPALGLALSVSFDTGRFDDARIVLSAATDRPTRLKSAETALRGSSFDLASLAQVADAAVDEAEIVSDSRGSAPYKRHLLRVHLTRALTKLAAAGP